MAGDFRLANDAWEAYFRTQATIAHELSDADVWGGLLDKEYAVLYALSSQPDGLRITELGEDVLLTQPGMSRLVIRLESRGLVERRSDVDARASRICLTDEGLQIQRRVGAALSRKIAQVMTRALNTRQLEQLRDLSVQLLAGADSAAATVQQKALERIRS